MTESNTQFFAGDLIKCSRINNNITQKDLADKLGWSQSYVSKVESGKLIPDAFEWMALSELFNFPADALRWGYIDSKHDISLTSASKEGGFQIPKDYRNDRGASLRFVSPLLNALEKEGEGNSLSREFLKENKLDPSFRSNLSHQVNLQFIEDLVSKFDVSDSVIKACGAAFASKTAHGDLWDSYRNSNSPLSSIKKFVKNMKKYQIFWDFELNEVSEHQSEITISPNQLILNDSLSNRSNNINKFFDKYWHGTLDSFEETCKKDMRLSVSKEASYFAGDETWKYSIIAS